MGFELPIALIGLIAAGVPIAAHLLKSRELPSIPLPTISLLRRVQSQSRQRRRLVDLALLVVRVLLIAALAVGAAKPFYSVRLAFGDGEVASVAIVLDDSFSMHQRVEDEPAFEVAKRRALQVIDALPSGAEVTVVLAGSPARVIVGRTRDLVAARSVIADIVVSARGGDLPRAVQLASRELAGARHERRHLLLLSDLGAHNSLEEIRLPSTGIEVALESIHSTTPANAAITGVDVAVNPTNAGLLKLSVDLHSFGRFDAPATLTLQRDGELLGQEPADLGSGHATVEFQVPVARTTALGELHLSGLSDAVPEDNRRVLPLRPPPALKVLLVDGDPDPARDRDEMGFIARVLDLAPAVAAVPIDYRTVDADAFDSERLDRVDVVVMANVAATQSRSWDRLTDYVRGGGGLWIAPGDRFRAATYSSKLGELLPARLRAAAAATPSLTVRAGLEGTLMSSDDHGLGGATVHRRVLLEGISADAHVELVLSDASPLLVVGGYGAGQVAFLSTTLDTDWGDLPIRPGFLPLVVRLITALANRPPPLSGPVRAADPVDVPLPRTATEAALVDPSGRSFPIDVDAPRFGRTGAMGYYRLRVTRPASAEEDYPDGSFVVWPPLEESDLTAGTMSQESRNGPSSAESGAWVRRALSPWLFVVAGFLFVAESVLRARRGTWVRRPKSTGVPAGTATGR